MNSQFNNSQDYFQFRPIGVVESCFTDKFGIPRQPGLAPSASGRIRIYSEFANEHAFHGLEQCSHIWLQFVFHANDSLWKPKVRPPRLGGNKSLGVFATRSPNRPNPIGLSVVAFHGWRSSADGFYLIISGHDLLDRTPVLDIKPYVPYADALPDAVNQVAPEAPRFLPVVFSDEAMKSCMDLHKIAKNNGSENLERLIREVLQQDPRPQYQHPLAERIYGMHLFDLNVRWCYEADHSNPLGGEGVRIRVLTVTRQCRTGEPHQV